MIEVFPGKLIQQIGFPKVTFTSQLVSIPQAGNVFPDLPGKTLLLLVPQFLRGLHFQFSHSVSNVSSTGILTCCPSRTLFSLRLGPTNPWLTDIAMETLDIRRAGFSPAFRYSSQHSHFYTLQQLLSGHLHSYLSTAKSIMYRTLPYPSSR